MVEDAPTLLQTMKNEAFGESSCSQEESSGFSEKYLYYYVSGCVSTGAQRVR